MWVKFLLLFFTFSFLFRTDLSFDQDLGRHIKLGEIIWQTKEVPKTNLFSYTNPDFEYINSHWLFEVLAYGFDQTIGVGWLLALKISIFLFSVWLILKVIPKENQFLLLPIGFIFLHVLRERLELRPEIFSFLFTAIALFMLERFLKTGSRLIFILPVIQLIWINTHIYFFVGLALQGIYLIHSLGVKLTHPRGVIGSHLGILAVVLISSCLISLINPHGISSFLYPLSVTKNYGYTIVENQTMFLLENIGFRDPNFLFVKISAFLVGLSVLVSLIRKGLNTKNLLISLFGLTLALMHVRGFPYLVLLSLPAVIQNFGAVKSNGLTQMLTAVVAILLLIESYLYLNGDYYKYTNNSHQPGLRMGQSVKGAMNFVLAKDLAGPIYNNFDIGSYILYRGYPRYKVFVDGRPEAYPKEFFLDTYIPTQSDYTRFMDLEKKWGFKTIIFSHTDQTPWGKAFLQNIVKDPAWIMIYIDDFVIILVRSDVIDEENLTVVDLSKLEPGSYQFSNHLSYIRIGYLLLSIGQQDSGKQFILKAKELFPESPIINQIIGDQVTNKFFW
ncbi:MAG: hypothetical protein AAB414_04075 [Patescibacteria group bacterium]